uniref:Reverse transcriptase n=1 Tax=Denticeps clupeoides TaxID=299321 RepID=A0AAY4C4B0_9TELE
MEVSNIKSYRMARSPGQQCAMGGSQEAGSQPIITRPPQKLDMARVLSFKEPRLSESEIETDAADIGWLQTGESVEDLFDDNGEEDEAHLSELEASGYALEHSLLVEPVLGSENTSEGETVTITLPNSMIHCQLCGEVPGGPMKAQEHFVKFHRDVPVVFSCGKCGKGDQNPRSILSHHAKCKSGAPQTSPARGHECTLCGQSFGTISGLSQHKRHVHPTERNEERIVAASQPSKKKGRKLQLWSQQEIERLRQLESHIQVAEKRRQLRESATPESTQVVGADPLAFLMTAPTMISVPSEIADSLRRETARLYGPAQEDGEDEVTTALRRWAVGNEPIEKTVEKVTAELLSEAVSSCDKKTHYLREKRDKVRTYTSYEWMKRRARSRALFGRYQCQYFKNRARLAALILDGNITSKCQIPASEVHDVYKKKWESSTQYGGLGSFTLGGCADNSVFEGLITAEEVGENLAAMNRTSATGPDKMNWKDVKDLCDGSTVVDLYNAWWATGKIPVAVKQCRSILLPKTADQEQLMEIGNWRPITIGSMLLRLFSRILTKRLARACPLNPRQRGFVQSPGCSENLMVLKSIMEQAKRERKHLAVVFIDVAKAFDSVSHNHIVDVLRRRGLDSHVIGVIQNSYEDCHTSIEVGGTKTPEIAIRTGVKQGDPMSPLLFNLAIDPLLATLETHGVGFQTEGGKIAALAFADDLVLLSDGWKGMSHNLSILEKFCNLTGLTVQAKKCHGFMITPTHDSYTVNNCQPWSIERAELHMVGPEESEKYLGVRIGPWTGISKPDTESQLQTWIQKIDEAPLKPSQKVVILNDYALPRLIYRADHAEETSVRLARLDGLVKRAVKAWLRLPHSTCDGLLYSWRKDGGMGLLKLADYVPSIQVRRIQRVAHSEDPTIRQLMNSSRAQTRFDKAWKRAGGTPDTAPALTDPITQSVNLETVSDGSILPQKVNYPVPRDWRKDEFEYWCRLPVQGMGTVCFRGDTISNHWLRNHRGFRERHYIAALQLRANVYPTRESLNRGRKGALLHCRKCSSKYESCSHILGQCPAIQAARIARHNKICDILGDEAKKLGWETHKEPRLYTTMGELRKPDMIFVREGVAIVVDVTVRWEYDSLSLAKAASEKVEYYQNLEQQVRDYTSTHTVHFFGFPVGARGKWHSKNDLVLQLLGVTKGRMKALGRLVARRALLYSLDMLKGCNTPSLQHRN